MPQILGPPLPPEHCPDAAENLIRRLTGLLAFRRPEHPLAALRIETDLLSHLTPGLPQRTFLRRPGDPEAPFAFPADDSFYANQLFPVLHDTRRYVLDGSDVLVLSGLVLATGYAPARAWQTEDNAPAADGILVPDRPNHFPCLAPAPAGLAKRLLSETLPDGPLITGPEASAHQRADAAARLADLGIATLRSAQARRLRSLDLHTLGRWRVLLAAAPDTLGRICSFPWALRRLPA
jgi:hypothetical protein